MNRKRKIFLDYDDVLVDCNGYAIRKLNSELNTSYTIYDVKEWGLLNNDLDRRLKYYSDPRFISEIPVLPGAREFVSTLSKKAEVFIMTSVEHCCASARFAHVVENFPEILPGNILLGSRKDMIRGDFILDDGHHNLKNSQIACPVMFQRPWNFSKTGVLSVDSYDAFLRLFETTCSMWNRDTGEANAVSIIGATGSGKKKLAEKLIETGLFERVKTYSTKKDPNYNYLDFNEFTRRRDQGFFSETSSYINQYYGMRCEDMQRILDKGKIPLMILDINGAMAIQSYCRALNVYVKAEKDECVRSILSRNNIDMDEKVQRIVSLDRELLNEDLCDITVTKNEYEKVMDMFS